MKFIDHCFNFKNLLDSNFLACINLYGKPRYIFDPPSFEIHMYDAVAMKLIRLSFICCILSSLFSFLIFSLQIVSRLVQIRDYITKASSMREDLVEKNERSANVERLTHLIEHLKEQEKSYMKFLQKILVSFGLFK